MSKQITYIGLIILSILSFVSCKSDARIEKVNVQAEISALKSNDLKTEYLENIFYEFQNILNEEDFTIRKFGQNSEEHISFIKKKVKEEKIYLDRVEAYFNTYGYPSRTTHGQYAAIAPLVVYFYASENKGFKKEHFKYFYGAYRFNDIPSDFFLAYLRVFYEIENGKTFNLQKNMESVDDEIEEILSSMGYEY
ncbi:MAG: hypothetical protein HKN51_07845 [Saprospiraceae bacterium]|nr:hypothetical protein [Saprospiraceae bacterium]